MRLEAVWVEPSIVGFWLKEVGAPNTSSTWRSGLILDVEGVEAAITAM